VYLLEGFYVLPTRKSAKFHEILRKFEPKWVITLHHTAFDRCSRTVNRMFDDVRRDCSTNW